MRTMKKKKKKKKRKSFLGHEPRVISLFSG